MSDHNGHMIRKAVNRYRNANPEQWYTYCGRKMPSGTSSTIRDDDVTCERCIIIYQEDCIAALTAENEQLHEISASCHGCNWAEKVEEESARLTAENDELKAKLAETYQREQHYRTALQDIRDKTPANMHKEWPHHHWYLTRASNAINHSWEKSKDE